MSLKNSMYGSKVEYKDIKLLICLENDTASPFKKINK